MSDGKSGDGFSQQQRGTASRSNPFAGESAPQDPDTTATITITAPNGAIRKYQLTDDVRERYERLYQLRIEGKVEWHEMWWNGTKLVIEYEGFIRDDTLRPSYETMDADEITQMMMSGQGPEVDGIPKRSHPGMHGGQRTPWGMQQRNHPDPSVHVDFSAQIEKGDFNRLDEGILPVIHRTKIDLQKRADRRPLIFEDLFIKPWSEESGQDPLTHEPPETEAFEADIRDSTRAVTDTHPDDLRRDRRDH